MKRVSQAHQVNRSWPPTRKRCLVGESVKPQNPVILSSRSQAIPDQGPMRSRTKSTEKLVDPEDRKSTRLNSSHTVISYAVFCLKKKKITDPHHPATSRSLSCQKVADNHS